MVNIYAVVLTSKSVAAEASFSILQTLSPVLAGAGILRAGELVEILIPGKGLKLNTYDLIFNIIVVIFCLHLF